MSVRTGARPSLYGTANARRRTLRPPDHTIQWEGVGPGVPIMADASVSFALSRQPGTEGGQPRGVARGVCSPTRDPHSIGRTDRCPREGRESRGSARGATAPSPESSAELREVRLRPNRVPNREEVANALDAGQVSVEPRSFRRVERRSTRTRPVRAAFSISVQSMGSARILTNSRGSTRRGRRCGGHLESLVA